MLARLSVEVTFKAVKVGVHLVALLKMFCLAKFSELFFAAFSCDAWHEKLLFFYWIISCLVFWPTCVLTRRFIGAPCM